MASIALPWADIKSYVDSVGPQRGRPPRPRACARPACTSTRIWYDGWRLSYGTVLVEGGPHRCDDGLWLQRVACALCLASWTLRPAFLYPHRSYAPDVVEAVCLSYLSDESATYAKVAARFGCSWTAVWGWISWLGRLVEPAEVLAEAVRLAASAASVELMPHAVPQDHPKGRSAERQKVLLQALQLLAALVVLGRAQSVPWADPSALRSFLVVSFLVFRRRALVSRVGWSPSIDVAHRGPPRR
ncbi:MAG: hypothetical protein ACREKS_00715 [Candidatus Rokuibacteriota bacterium]